MNAALDVAVDFDPIELQDEPDALPQPMCLRDLMSDPEALKPPEPVVFPLAWRGRSTLLSAREKDGKSTLAAGAIAARSRAWSFLGQTPAVGISLLVALEEHPHDIVRRFHELGAYPECVYILDRLGEDRYATLENAIEYSSAEFVVVDTLAAFTDGMNLDSGDASAWTATIRALTRMARDLNVGLTIVHHGRKEDGAYRDSTAIGATVDMLVSLSDTDVPGVKKLTPKGRWELHPMEFRIQEASEGTGGPRFVLTSGGLSMDMKVFLFVQANPGCSTRAIRDGVTGNNEQKALAVTRLEGGGYIENRGGGRGNAYHAVRSLEDAR